MFADNEHRDFTRVPASTEGMVRVMWCGPC